MANVDNELIRFAPTHTLRATPQLALSSSGNDEPERARGKEVCYRGAKPDHLRLLQQTPKKRFVWIVLVLVGPSTFGVSTA